jgi:uncharacterized protein
MKIVLDTNVLISGIFWKGPPHTIMELWIKGDLQIFVTKKILKEYFEVLNRMDASGAIAKKWQLLILEKVLVAEEKEIVKLSRDPHDDKFINCALATNASYIVSGDQDLLTLKQIAEIKIVTPTEFLKIYTCGSNNCRKYI